MSFCCCRINSSLSIFIRSSMSNNCCQEKFYPNLRIDICSAMCWKPGFVLFSWVQHTTPAGLLSSRFIEYVLHMFLLIQDKFLNSIHVFKMSERGVENLDFWKSLCANGIKPPTNKAKYLESIQKHLYKELGVERQECSEATYKDIDKQASNFL